MKEEFVCMRNLWETFIFAKIESKENILFSKVNFCGKKFQISADGKIIEKKSIGTQYCNKQKKKQFSFKMMNS